MSELDAPLRLLVVVAHPDDESVMVGGTIARSVAEGVQVHVAIMTDGAAGGTHPAVAHEPGTLVEIRAREMAAAAAYLGVELHPLNYRDSGMEGTEDNRHPDALLQRPLDVVADDLLRLIREVRPHVIVTHGRNGEYFHPDHIRTHQAVERAVVRSRMSAAGAEEGSPPWRPLRLFAIAHRRSRLQQYARLMRLFGKDPTRAGSNGDLDLTRLGTRDEMITTRIDVSDYVKHKRDGFALHKSQNGGSPSRMPLRLYRLIWGTEYFEQLFPPTPLYHDDLFEALRTSPPTAVSGGWQGLGWIIPGAMVMLLLLLPGREERGR